MKELFGKSKFDIEIGDNTKEIIIDSAKNAWIGSYKNYIAKGYNRNQIEEIQDILSPNGDITENEISNYSNRILSIENKLKK